MATDNGLMMPSISTLRKIFFNKNGVPIMGKLLNVQEIMRRSFDLQLGRPEGGKAFRLISDDHMQYQYYRNLFHVALADFASTELIHARLFVRIRPEGGPVLYGFSMAKEDLENNKERMERRTFNAGKTTRQIKALTDQLLKE